MTIDGARQMCDYLVLLGYGVGKKRVMRLIGLESVYQKPRTSIPHPEMDMDESFMPIFEASKRFSMTSIERMYNVYKATQYIVQSGLEGAFVECGVWRGGSMMVVSRTLQSMGVADKDLWFFDTYEGLPKPDEDKDIDIWGNRAIDGWLPKFVSDESSLWGLAGLDDVRANLLSTGYPERHLHFVKGLVQRTLPALPRDSMGKIALLRLDTDWYDSTKCELEHLYDRLIPQGVLILDDYGHFKGARKAVDDFFREKGIHILLNRVDYSGRCAIKPV